jgi:hypothetical protein
VSLTDTCRTETGKMSVGAEVKYSLKFSWIVSASAKLLTSISRSCMKEAAKWQFCSMTQLPTFMASSTMIIALGPCP